MTTWVELEANVDVAVVREWRDESGGLIRDEVAGVFPMTVRASEADFPETVDLVVTCGEQPPRRVSVPTDRDSFVVFSYREWPRHVDRSLARDKNGRIVRVVETPARRPVLLQETTGRGAIVHAEELLLPLLFVSGDEVTAGPDVRITFPAGARPELIEADVGDFSVSIPAGSVRAGQVGIVELEAEILVEESVSTVERDEQGDVVRTRRRAFRPLRANGALPKGGA